MRYKRSLRWAGLTALALALSGGAVITTSAAAPAASSPLKQGPIAVQTTPSGRGYWIASRAGEVVPYGDAGYYKDLPELRVSTSNIVGMAPTPSGRGYWLAGADGGVFAFGDAGFYNSLPGLKVKVSNIVGITATPSGRGYWLAGADGGVFAFGDAGFYNSLPGLKVKVSNIVGITATPSGRGYWLAGADGGVFALGDAGFYHSLPGLGVAVNNVVGINRTPSGRGYWLVGADGGVFAFGDAPFHRSMGGTRLNVPVVGMSATPSGAGYLLAARDGGVFAFGNAPFHGRPTVVDVPVTPPPGTRQPARNLTLSAAGVEFIASFEGFRSTPYYDGYAACTIGYGYVIHTGRCTAQDSSLWNTITESEGRSLLRQVAEERFASALRRAHPGTPLAQHEFDALVSWLYNVGVGAASTGVVSGHLAAAPPRYGDVPAGLKLWINAGGQKSCGLYRRRVSEGNLFTTGSYTRLSPACPF